MSMKRSDKEKSSDKAAQDKGKAGKGNVSKTIADNRKARHEYEVIESIEAGIALTGTEVKSMRQGQANLKESFAKIENLEVFLHNCHVSVYDHGNRFNHDPVRKRRLLLHKSEILRLKSKVQEKGLTLIPLKLYFKGNLVKLSLGLCKGKQLHDKRESISRRDTKRQLDRLVKSQR